MKEQDNAKGLSSLLELSEFRMLLRLSWPIVVSMMVQELYGLVDSMFLARLGEEALSAMSLLSVLTAVFSAFFTGIATGMNAVISRAHGAGDWTGARRAMISGCVLQVVFTVVLCTAGFLLTPAYFMQTTPNRNVIGFGITYMNICLAALIFMSGQITLERLLQMTGLSKYMTISQVIGTLVNVLLDPLLIFGLFGFPRLEMAGAAVATVAGQCAACLAALWFNIRKNHLLFDASLRIRMFNWPQALEICRIGIPTATVGIAGAAGNYCINNLLIRYSDTANAAFGAYAKIQSTLLIPTQGCASALVTMFSLFYGQQNMKRIRATVRTGLKTVGIWSVFCGLLLMLAPRLCLSLFSPTPQMLEIGVPCCRIVGATFFCSLYFLVINSFFQTFGKSMYSFAFSFARQIFVRIPVAILLVRLGPINWIWWSWPISEVTSDAVALVLFVRLYRKLQTQLPA